MLHPYLGLLKFNLINKFNNFSFMSYIQYNRDKLWNILLLMIRIWLGYRMTGSSYSSVIDIIFHPAERAFFERWFGAELHFPFPVVMAFIAKGAEFAGGIFVGFGLFTRISAGVIAFTMLVATLTANLGENFIIDGGFTISYVLFGLILIIEGGGKFSFDYLRLKRRNKKGKELRSPAAVVSL